MAPSKKKTAAHFPSKADILRFIDESPDNVGKREIARTFNITGDSRTQLKRVMREMREEGLIKSGHRKTVDKKGTLPNVTVIEVAGTDVDGELLARLVNWDEDDAPPIIYVAPGKRRVDQLGVGDRALCRLIRQDDGTYEAQVMKKLQAARDKVLGVYRRDGDPGGRIVPTDKRSRHELAVSEADSAGAKHGELVLAEVLSSSQNRLGLKQARVVERLGDISSAKSTSLIAVHTHGIPVEFDPEAIKEAKLAQPVSLGTRTDLRDIPLIPIDPADARDHDDAVWAAPDHDPNNKNGWQVIVAIADVAHYVRVGTAIDRDGFKRGNSVYFPDRVVPMLPEELSTDLCSLKPGVDRACMAVHMWFDAGGHKRRHKFVRGLMRSAANLSYEQVQAAYDGQTDGPGAALLENVIQPLYAAYFTRLKERAIRQPLDLDLPERKVILDDEGNVASIQERTRFDAHRLIEEFMIVANVAAAEELEKHQTPCMYRVHDAPAPEKLAVLQEFLESIKMKVPKTERLSPRHFNQILAKVVGTPHGDMANMVVLRSQSQALYSPDNLGHFGLSLERYAHFTSPIRRYADLMVHRGLIRALKLGDDGLSEDVASRFHEIGEHISVTERRAMYAERDAIDRYMAAFMADKVGAKFEGRISGVSRFGLFVTLNETGADGLIPISKLGREYFRHEEKLHALVGDESGTTFRLGDPATVRLAEATPLTGGLRFELLYDAPASRRPAKNKGGRHRRPG
ncbi:MAG: ribonuclease R [Proteobacteria bacterium]|nr:ribonuclease R [Pseudomonadota bacterium]